MGSAVGMVDFMTYIERVRELEDEGLTTSDAQGVADHEHESGAARFEFNPDAPLDPYRRDR